MDGSAHRVAPNLFPGCGPWTTAALTHGFGDALLPESDLTAELDVIQQQKLAPLLLHLLRTRSPDSSPVGIEALRRDTVERVARSRAVRVVGREVVERLEAAGIDVVVTKGAGLAAHYRWPAVRTSTDVDLLVPPRQFRAAFELLAGAGWGELARSLQPWPGFHRWCREGANLVTASGDCVDLHHRPSPWLWGDRLGHDTVSAAAARVDGVLTACGADNLAIAALQLIGDHTAPGTKLVAWRDIAELGLNLETTATATRLIATGTGGVVRWLAAQLPSPLRPNALIEALPPVPPERSVRLAAMLATARRHHPMASHAVRLPVGNAGLFLLGSAVPARRFRSIRRRTALGVAAESSLSSISGQDSRHD